MDKMVKSMLIFAGCMIAFLVLVFIFYLVLIKLPG